MAEPDPQPVPESPAAGLRAAVPEQTAAVAPQLPPRWEPETAPAARLHMRLADAPPAERFAVTGSHAALGSWNPRGGSPLECRGGHWATKRPVSLAPGDCVEFKFVRLRPDGVEWEQGPNRVLEVPLSDADLELKGRFDGDIVVSLVEPDEASPMRAACAWQLRHAEAVRVLAAQRRSLEASRGERRLAQERRSALAAQLRAELQQARREAVSLDSVDAAKTALAEAAPPPGGSENGARQVVPHGGGWNLSGGGCSPQVVEAGPPLHRLKARPSTELLRMNSAPTPLRDFERRCLFDSGRSSASNSSVGDCWPWAEDVQTAQAKGWRTLDDDDSGTYPPLAELLGPCGRRLQGSGAASGWQPPLRPQASSWQPPAGPGVAMTARAPKPSFDGGGSTSSWQPQAMTARVPEPSFEGGGSASSWQQQVGPRTTTALEPMPHPDLDRSAGKWLLPARGGSSSTTEVTTHTTPVAAGFETGSSSGGRVQKGGLALGRVRQLLRQRSAGSGVVRFSTATL